MTIKLNPDQKIVDVIKSRLEVTDGMCPCISQDLWNEDYKCPCKKFREEQKCCCNLYVNINE